jgi:hypothetical protein
MCLISPMFANLQITKVPYLQPDKISQTYYLPGLPKRPIYKLGI